MAATTLPVGVKSGEQARKVKKVLVIEPGGKGGICHYAYNLCQALAEQGLDVHLLTNEPFELKRFPCAFTVHEFQLRSPKGLMSAFARIREIKPDVIHQQGTNLHPLFEWVVMHVSRIQSGAPFIYTCHLAVPHESTGWEAPFIGRKLRSSQAVIVHSDVTMKEAVDLYSLKPERVSIIPHGNYKFFCAVSGLGKDIPWRKEPGVKDILFFGAIREYKGLQYLLEAIAMLKDQGRAVRLMVVGKPVEPWSKYETKIAELGIEDNMLLALDYVDMEDVPTYYGLADCACLPYLDGSESGVLLLADAFDLPIVATNTGGNQKAFDDGYVQALAPPKDAASLAQGLTQVLFETSREQFLETKASRNDEARSWSIISGATIDLYESLL